MQKGAQDSTRLLYISGLWLSPREPKPALQAGSKRENLNFPWSLRPAIGAASCASGDCVGDKQGG